MSATIFASALGTAFRWINRYVVWHRLPFFLAVLNLLALRVNLRRFNLFDTETARPRAPTRPPCGLRCGP